MPCKKYNLRGKSACAVQPMLDDHQTLSDASIQMVDGQTIMKFAKLLQEDGEIEIVAGKNIMLFAHGGYLDLEYHGPQARMACELTL